MRISLPTRRLIPKWRPTAVTLASTDSVPLTTKKNPTLEGSLNDFERVAKLWEEENDPGVMGDLLSFSIHQDLTEKVLEIAKNAVSTGAHLTPIQLRFIRDLSSDHLSITNSKQLLETTNSTDDPIPFQDSIRKLRTLLKTENKDSLALLDYAQLQAAIGKHEAARRSILCALTISPNNRVVLRTAARFFVHTGDPIEAHSLIKKHPRTPLDPWLMASEIALADASNRESIMASKGRRFLHDNKLMPATHLTELAGAIAIRELSAGNMKLARESQRRALIAPNDNVIAQAIEMQNQFGIELESHAIHNAILNSSEAQVLQAWSVGSPLEALSSARAWHAQEPFSSRPVQLLSCIFAYQDKLSQAEEWTKVGLRADPSDTGFLINMAFIQTRQRDYVAAKQTLKRLRTIDGSANSEPFVLATEGLAEYQNGNFTLGDAKYATAVRLFIERRDFHVAAFCKLNQALFAEDTKHQDLSAIANETVELLEKYGSSDCFMLLKIRQSSSIEAPEQSEPMKRRLSQWVFDSEKNTLFQKEGITSIGAPGFVALPTKK